MEIVKFLFSNFWTWLGGLIYLVIICAAITQFRVFVINNNHNYRR